MKGFFRPNRPASVALDTSRTQAVSIAPAKTKDAKQTPRSCLERKDDFARWTFDNVEPVSRHQEMRNWLHSIGLISQEDYLVDPAVAVVRMGLGWDKGADVDASAVLLDERGRTVDVVWYKKLRSTCGSVEHSGDNLTGVGDGDDEVITVKLAEIPLHVHHLLFTVCIFSYGVSFSEIKSAYVRMMHGKEKYRNHEMCRFLLSQMSGHSMLMGLLVRKGPYWNFKALGTPASGRNVIELLKNPANLACLAENPSHKPELRDVTVTVLAGRNLAPKDSPGFFGRAASSDPYFVVEFKNKKYTSEHKPKTLEPQWKSSPFQLGPITEVEPKALKIRLFDHDIIGAHEFMGMVRVPGHALFSLGGGDHTFWFALSDSKEKAYRKEVVSGEILVNLKIDVAQPCTHAQLF